MDPKDLLGDIQASTKGSKKCEVTGECCVITHVALCELSHPRRTGKIAISPPRVLASAGDKSIFLYRTRPRSFANGIDRGLCILSI